MAETIAKIMMVVGPLTLVIAIPIFIFFHRERWIAEISSLKKEREQRGKKR